VHRVDGRRDRVKPHEAVEHRVVEQELHDRGRVREPGRLDQHAAEGRDLASVAAGEETAQGLGKVAAHRAADAAARHHGDLARDRLDEQVIEGNLAELVDDHGAVAHARMAQEPVQQRRLARAEIAGDHRHRNALGRSVLIEQAHRLKPAGNFLLDEEPSTVEHPVDAGCVMRFSFMA